MSGPLSEALPLAEARVDRAPPAPSRPRLRASPLETAVVETVTETRGLAALEAEWGELLRQSPADGLFLTPEWLATWWRHLGAGSSLELLTVRRAGRLEALAPLRLAAAPRERWLGPTLQWLGTGRIGSDYLDVVLRPGAAPATLDALAAALARRGAAIDLGQLAPGSTARDLAARLAARGWTVRSRDTAVCPVADLPAGGFDAYLAGLGAAHRANFRRRLRRLEREHALRFETVAAPEQVDPALAVLFDLHARRWRDRGGSDAFGEAAVAGFHRELARRALEQGWLRLQVLILDGRPAAAIYGFRYGQRFLFYQSGFDPALAPLGVGLVAMGLSIRAAVEEGAREYDLLHGAEPYKFLWARRIRPLERVEILPPTARGRLRRATRGALDLARRLRRPPALRVERAAEAGR